jgi:hypothetical protein
MSCTQRAGQITEGRKSRLVFSHEKWENGRPFGISLNLPHRRYLNDDGKRESRSKADMEKHALIARLNSDIADALVPAVMGLFVAVPVSEK